MYVVDYRTVIGIRESEKQQKQEPGNGRKKKETERTPKDNGKEPKIALISIVENQKAPRNRVQGGFFFWCNGIMRRR
jgi:hypothetical protein